MAGSTKFAEASRACQDNECPDYPGHLDINGVVAVIEEVAELSSSSDKVGNVLTNII